MKIRFDPDLRIAGIGLVPWNRLGLEQWLPHYAIASLYNWDIADQPGVPPVFCLSNVNGAPQLSTMSTHALLRAPAFQRLLQNELAGYDFLTYKPVKVPVELAGRRFLMADAKLAKTYENKVTFRKMFSDSVKFPPFAVYERQQLQTTLEYYTALLADRSQIVFQDEQLSGGKGTFIISSYKQYVAALQALAALSEHRMVVVSDMISDAKERSVQCCVTKAEVIVGPLQRQIVRQPQLCNPDIPEGDKFCGAQIVALDQQTALHQEVTAIAKQIGQALQREGYRGIFGIDFLLAPSGELFVLEVNPRLTGVTPLLTALQRDEDDIPFYLLHLLELGNYEYTIEDPTTRFSGSGSLLVVHSLDQHAGVIDQMPQSGTYKSEGKNIVLVNRNIRLQEAKEQEFILQAYALQHTVIKPGGRLVTLQFKRPVIDTDTDKLYNDTFGTIRAIRQHISVRPL